MCVCVCVCVCVCGKVSASNVGDLGSIPGLGRSPGEGKGYPFQYSGLENSIDYSSWDRKESDMTECLSRHFTSYVYIDTTEAYIFTYLHIIYLYVCVLSQSLRHV